MASALAPALLLLALAGCGGDDEDAAREVGEPKAAGHASDLPRPEGAAGSVTGMPAHPGPGTVPLETIGGDGTQALDASQLAELQVATEATFAPALLPLPEPVPAPDAAPAVPMLVMPPPAPTPEADEAAPTADDATAGREFVVPDQPPGGTDDATESTTFRTEPEAPPDD